MRAPIIPQVGLPTGSVGRVSTAGGVEPVRGVRSQQMQSLGGEAQKAGEVAMGLAAMLRDEADTAASKEALNRWGSTVTEMLENPDTGYLHLQGKAAVGEARTQLLSRMESERRELEKSLANDVQRSVFGAAADRLATQVKSQVYGHEATQRRIWNAGETKASIAQSIRAAATARRQGDVPADVAAAGAIVAQGDQLSVPGANSLPGAATDSSRPSWEVFYDSALEQAGDLADLMGLPAKSAQREELLADTREQAHLAMIDGLLAADRVQEAQAHFAEHGGNLRDDTRLKVGKQLEESTRADQALRMALDIGKEFDASGVWKDPSQIISSTASPGQDPRRGIGQLLAQARQKLDEQFLAGKIDARTHQMALAQVESTIQDRVKQSEAAASDLLRSTAQWFDSVPPTSRSVDNPEFVKSGLRQQLVEYGLLGRAASLADAARQTDPQAYLQLQRDRDSGHLVGMSNEALFTRYYGRLAGSEWAEAQRAHAEANQVAGSSTKKIPNDDFYGWEDQALETAFANGVVTSRTPTGKPVPADKGDEPARYIKWRAEVQRRMNVQRSAKGSDLTTEEKVAIAAGVSGDKARIPGVFSDTQTWVWDAAPDSNQEDERQKSLTYRTTTGEDVRFSEVQPGFVDYVNHQHRANMLVHQAGGPHSPGGQKILEEMRSAGAYSFKRSAEQTAQLNQLWSALKLDTVSAPRSEIVEMWSAGKTSWNEMLYPKQAERQKANPLVAPRPDGLQPFNRYEEDAFRRAEEAVRRLQMERAGRSQIPLGPSSMYGDPAGPEVPPERLDKKKN